MSDIIEMFANIADSVIEISFLILILGIKKRKIVYNAIALVVSICICYSVSLILGLNENLIGIDFLVVILSDMLIAEILCKGYHLEKLAIVILLDGVVTISSILTAMLVPLVFQSDIESTFTQNGSAERIMAIVLAKGIELIICLLVARVMKKIDYDTGEGGWIPLVVLLAGSDVCSNFAMSMMRMEDETKKNSYLLLIIIGLFAVDTVVFILFVGILHKTKEELLMKAFTEKINADLDLVKAKENALEEMRGLRHEIRNEYIPIKEMLRLGEVEKAIKKMEGLVDDGEKTFRKVKLSDTGSASVNAVLNYYSRIFYDDGIDCDFEVRKLNYGDLPEDIVCSILLNLLKNAHEALERYGKKQVMLSMVNEKDYIRIDVENRIPADIGAIDVSRTSKEDSKNHGFGIRSVRKTVEDNGGMFTQFVRDEFFVSEVWLLIIFD